MKLELFKPVRWAAKSQGFGENPQIYKPLGIKGHNGIDWVYDHGTPIRAAHPGIVTYAGIANDEGVGVVIRTLEPYEYEGGAAFFKSIYWHLTKNVPVKVGQKVKTGDVIGYMGNSGFVSPKPSAGCPKCGTHLHFGIKPIMPGEDEWTWENALQDNGYKGAIDPAPYFTKYSAEEIAGFQVQIDAIRLKVEAIMRKMGLIK